MKEPREIYLEIRDDKKKLREILELGREKASWDLSFFEFGVIYLVNLIIFFKIRGA